MDARPLGRARCAALARAIARRRSPLAAVGRRAPGRPMSEGRGKGWRAEGGALAAILVFGPHLPPTASPTPWIRVSLLASRRCGAKIVIVDGDVRIKLERTTHEVLAGDARMFCQHSNTARSSAREVLFRIRRDTETVVARSERETPTQPLTEDRIDRAPSAATANGSHSVLIPQGASARCTT